MTLIKETPGSLDLVLGNYRTTTFLDPVRGSNILPENLAERVIGYQHGPKKGIPGGGFKRRGKQPTLPNVRVYFFFEVKPDSLSLKFASDRRMYLALDRDLYGFSPDEVVEINPQEVTGLNLSEKSSKLYEQILGSGQYNLNDLLESVGRIVNASVAYDFNEFSNRTGVREGDPLFDSAMGGYSLNGDETIDGVCTDAGRMIRQILFNLGLPGYIGVTSVSSNNGITSHDTTLVFNGESGRWAVLNSKSPTKKYNLVPKDKLNEIGRPFV